MHVLPNSSPPGRAQYETWAVTLPSMPVPAIERSMLPVRVKQKLPHEEMKPLALRLRGPNLAPRLAPMYQASSPSAPPTWMAIAPLSLTTLRIFTDPQAEVRRTFVGPRVSMMIVPWTSRSNTGSRLALMSTLAAR